MSGVLHSDADWEGMENSHRQMRNPVSLLETSDSQFRHSEGSDGSTAEEGDGMVGKKA
jgi:hypothetical protein